MHDENNKGCPWNRTIGKQNWAADGNCTCSPAPRQHETWCGARMSPNVTCSCHISQDKSTIQEQGPFSYAPHCPNCACGKNKSPFEEQAPTSAPVEGWTVNWKQVVADKLMKKYSPKLSAEFVVLIDSVISSLLAKERAIAENEGARQERQIISLNLAATYGTAFRKDGVGFYLPSVAEIREEARADERKKLIEEVREWANNYMEETTKHYGTDKHGIDPDDLGDYLSSLAANNKSS